MGSKRWLKCSVKSVSSVREKTPHELNSAQISSVKSVSSVREKMFFVRDNTPNESTCVLKSSVNSVRSVRDNTPHASSQLFPWGEAAVSSGPSHTL